MFISELWNNTQTLKHAIFKKKNVYPMT